MRWEAAQPDGAPLQLLPDARPGRRGWGPHRLGIKHSGGPRPGWWQPGSELWSNALGKECPGDAKVAQIPGLITEAREGTVPAPTPPEEDDDMLVLISDATGTNPRPWWVTDGLTKRYCHPGEPQNLKDLGRVATTNAKWLSTKALEQIPVTGDVDVATVYTEWQTLDAAEQARRAGQPDGAPAA